MYTDLKPVSLMGLPNKMTCDDAFLPEKKGFHAMLKREFLQVDKSAVSLKIKLTSDDDHGEDGGMCRTPTSVDHMRKNVIVLKCPPAPRKPKSQPSKKRKAETERLDLSNEIHSLFPPNLLRDFVCGKIRKVSKESIAFM